jgi:flagellar motility protein MotE (MotC chaperone)
MVEELENQEAAPETAEDKKPTGLLINVKTIMIGAGAFVVFLVVFSVMMGVFSSPKQPAVADAPETVQAVEEEMHAEAGDPYTSAWNSEYDDGYAEIDEADSSHGGLSEEDSVKHVAWYVAQKEEIDRERVRLRAEMAELQQLKMETEALLTERKNLEQNNIANMAKLFDTMKAQEVAAIIQNIPDMKVGLILQKMKKQNASKVMAELPSERAATITMQLIDMDGEY